MLNYTNEDLEEISSKMAQHIDDGKILFASNDKEIAAMVPLVQKGFAKAVIAPHKNPEKFAVESENLLGDQMNRFKAMADSHGSLEQYSSFVIKEEQIYRANGIDHTGVEEEERLLTTDELEDFPSFIHSIASTIPHKLGMTENFRYHDCLRQESGGQAPVTDFHCDALGVTAHVSGYNPIEYVIKDITQEEKSILTGDQSKHKTSINAFSDAVTMNGRVRQAYPGDLMVFKDGLPHRSSPTSPSAGQVNVALEFDVT